MVKKSITHKEIVGIIGGIGPEATNYFTSLLVKLRLPYSSKDQDHIPYFLFNNPQIPDRSKHILFHEESPVPELVRSGLLLKKIGATFLVLPCNTSHPFAEEIEKGVGLPVMNMITLTVKYIAEHYGDNVTVGVLGTDGTIKSGIYQETFKRLAPGITTVLPDAKSQIDVMRAIYDIKASSVNELNSQLLYNAAQKLIQKGASIVILGCTEIPLAIPEKAYNFIRIDPMELLAQKVIEKTLKSKTHILHETSKIPSRSIEHVV